MISLSKSILDSLNITEPQAQVYLAALELGEASMADLSKKSGVKRTSIYNFISELKGKQLIVETRKRKRTVYSAVHPEQFVEIEKARLKEVERALPELLAIQNQSKTKPRVTFYEGVVGIKEVYADTLKDKQPIVGWSDFEHMAKILGVEYFDVYPAERARRNITFKTILRDTPIARELSKKDIRYLRESKYMDSEDLKTEINIYGNKVALISFQSRPPFVVLIEDHDLATTLRVIWKKLWERLP